MKKLLFSIFTLLGTMSLYAQDPHFSQYDLTPSMISPALAGANHDIQANTAYRNQWNSVGYAFQTTYMSAEVRLISGKRIPKGFWGLGMVFMNDAAGSARMTNNSMGMNLAYHILLKEGHTFGLGMNAGVAFNSISGTNGRWASQFDGVEYNMTIPSGEQFNAVTYSVFDIGAGLLYTYKKKEIYMTKNDSRQLNIGASAFHLNRPQHSFIDRDVAKLPIRFVGFANMIYGIDDTRLVVEPGVYYLQQGKARDILAGSMVKYVLKDQSARTTAYTASMIGLGLFYRNFDALVARMSYEQFGFNLSLGYDFNISTLAQASRGLGGFEIGLRWTLDDPYTSTRIKK
jgi:type IX secretion system PorP/SprF family membrane protein